MRPFPELAWTRPVPHRQSGSGWFIVALACACTGVINDDEPSDDGSGREPSGAGVTTTPAGAAPAATSRFARLTHTQWENTVRDLLRLESASGLSETFPADARTAGFLFDNHQISLD